MQYILFEIFIFFHNINKINSSPFVPKCTLKKINRFVQKIEKKAPIKLLVIFLTKRIILKFHFRNGKSFFFTILHPIF